MSSSYGDGSWRKRGKKWEYRFQVLNPSTGMPINKSVTADTKDGCRNKAQAV